MADFVYRGFDLADEYRMPVLILADGAIGQMMEAVEFPEYDPEKDRVDHSSWTTVGQPEDEERHIITSLFLDPDIMEKVNLKLQDKYKTIQEKEVQFETVMVEDANYLVVAYGLSARVSHKAVELAREQGIKVGLLRPQTLFPFPSDALSNYASKVQRMLVVEMNAGQMVEDVRLAVEGKVPIEFYGKMGGAIPTPEEVLDQIKILSSFKIVKGS
jgi:2-oxoglutarate ferredoxin oxidoreductase subunit alpha